MTLRFTELAVADLLEAREHNREIYDQLELRFLDQVDPLVDRLVAFPNGATPVDGFPGIRRARVRWQAKPSLNVRPGKNWWVTD